MRRTMATIAMCLLVLGAIQTLHAVETEITTFVFNPGRSPSISPFSETVGRVRIGVERVAVHRYFAIYSYVTGDQSALEIEFTMEQLDHLNLQKGEVRVTAVSDLGEKMTPYPYYELRDFPPDNPLGYKLTLWLRFPPPPREVNTVDFDIRYLGSVYRIKSVPIR